VGGQTYRNSSLSEATNHCAVLFPTSYSCYPHLSSNSVTQNLPVHLTQFDCRMLSFAEHCKYGSVHFRELPLESPELSVTNRYYTKVIATPHLFSNLFNVS